MTMLEDRVRRAIHAKAGEIPPGPLPPLRLPARHRWPAWRGLSARLSGGRGPSLAAPIAAAIAVVAVIAAVFAAAGAIHPGTPPRPRPVAAPSGAPRYYLALAFTGACCEPGEPRILRSHAVVRVTATGRAVATITPPRPYQQFIDVTAADDHTFVLAAQGASTATKFFLLRLGRGGRPASLTSLHIPLVTGFTDFALSPNGALLAVAAGGGPPSLFVYNLATGAERTWIQSGIGPNLPVDPSQDSLSWTADGRALALIFWGDPAGGGVRLLDVAARGSDLLANSRLVVGRPKNRGPGYWIQARVTPDGHTIIGIRDPTAHFSQQLVAFSARTGKVLRVLGDIGFRYGGDEGVAWTSPSGNVLIVTDAKRGRKKLHASYFDANAGVLKDGHYTPLPWPRNTFAAAW